MAFDKSKYVWILLGLSALLLLPGLGKAPLWIYDEVRNAQCAREMYERGDWIVPTFNGELRTLKPPLHYYFMFIGFELFGVNEWGARFFSTLFGMFTVFITFGFVKRYSTDLHGFISALVLLLSSHFLFQFRMSVPDPYLIFFNTLSIFAAFNWFMEKKFRSLIISAICFGLGILAKGPVALVLPGIALLAWAIWENKWKQLLTWRILVAFIVMLVVAVPWYWFVHQKTNGEWTKGFFFDHNLGRFSQPMEGHGGIFLIVPLFVLIGLLPSSALIAESLKNFKKRFTNPLLKLGFCVMSAFLIFYSISGTKLPNYPVPCYPFIAILLGYVVCKGWYEPQKIKIYPFLILLAINIALPLFAYFGIKNEKNTNGLENYATLFFILTLAGMTATYFMMRKHFRRAVVSLFILYTVFNIFLLNWFYPSIYNENPMTRTIEKVRAHKNVVAYQIFHPSFTYYLPERVRVFKQLDSLNIYLMQNEAAVISRKNYTEELKSLQLKEIATIHDLFEGNTTAVYSNKK